MIKKSALVLVLIIWCLVTNGQYITPNSGVTWDLDDLVYNSEGAVTLEGNVYYIHDNLIISEFDTVRIISDETIKIFSQKLITIKGAMQVQSPEELMISAVDTMQNYLGFRFENSNASFFENCTIEFGGGIELVESDVRFEGCKIRKNNKSNSTGAIDLFNCNPVIIDCDIFLNEGPAILSPANGGCSPYISGNWIYRNNTANTNMPQVNLGPSDPGTDIQILNNVIDGFYDRAGGIAVTTLAGGSVSCIIDGNVIKNNRYGITAYGYDINTVISNNILADNNIENLPLQGGSGINFWGGTSNTSMVVGNEIYGNLWGITNTGNALPNMGQVEPDTINPGGNIIYNNGNEGVTYALYNNTPNDIFAENNYWGSYNLDTVAAVIFDYYDDETLGIIDYLPIKDYVTRVLVVNSHTPVLEIFPNPASNYISINLPEYAAGIGKVLIFNASGKIVSEQNVTQTYHLNITSLDAGVYLVYFTNDKITLTGKFIKQ
ncbi:MAG: T9SS type A sorting domain-containing protein [Bacteroidales bacterium]|nr:T9SS type A sorting domain-containing protein [Bacteroidales bacterium]